MIALAVLVLGCAALVGIQAPASAGSCTPYGCGGEVYNMNPDFGANDYTVRVTYAWNANNTAVMNKWAKQVQPQRAAGCHTLVGEELRCDVDGIYTPSGFNVWCYNQAGDAAYQFTTTGWHKIWNLADVDCERLPQ